MRSGAGMHRQGEGLPPARPDFMAAYSEDQNLALQLELRPRANQISENHDAAEPTGAAESAHAVQPTLDREPSRDRHADAIVRSFYPNLTRLSILAGH
jgi:hypothetical protein